MKDYHKTEGFAYRFMDLSGTKMVSFKKITSQNTHKVIKSRNDETFNVIFDLNNNFYVDEIQELVDKLEINERSRGLWVSLSTERDSDGIHVPDPIRKAYLRLGGQLDFSFTFIDGEE